MYTDPTNAVIRIFGVMYDNITMEEALGRAVKMALNGKGAYIVTPNTEILSDAQKNSELMKALAGASLTIPDGSGVILASKILGTPMKKKIAGVEFGESLLPLFAEKDIRVFLYGAGEGVAEEAAGKMKEKYPLLKIAGTCSGYISDNEKICGLIRDSGAEVLYVCTGSPKQELWISKYKSETGAKLILALGGSLDIYSGKVKRAPEIFIKSGLEWFYRLLQSPSRIRRILKIPVFLLRTVKYRLTGR